MVVVDRRRVAQDEDVVQLTLVAPDGTKLPEWHAGAHIDLHLPSGRMPQYSLCGDPRQEREYRIAVRRIPGGGGGSVEVHGLVVGQIVEISEPRNAFMMPLPGSGSRAEKLRFIAGGIGITPILPMARLAERLGVPWSLCYTGRHRDSLPFLDELLAFGDKVWVRTDDEHGLPTAAELLDGVDGRTAVYVCGPPPMMEAVRRNIPLDWGTELHIERFSPLPVVDGSAVRVGAGVQWRGGKGRWGPERLGRVTGGPARRELLLSARFLRHLRPAGAHRRGGASRQHPHRPATGVRSDAGLRLQGQIRRRAAGLGPLVGPTDYLLHGLLTRTVVLGFGREPLDALRDVEGVQACRLGPATPRELPIDGLSGALEF